jgi:Na+/melibiose symporter-like transporter
VIAIVSMVIFASYAITRSRHAAIAAELRARASGTAPGGDA